MITRSWLNWEHKTALVKAEWLIFGGNCIFVLLTSSVMNEPKAVVFNLGLLGVYRFVLFNRLKAGSSFAAWWYTVTASLSALRFIAVLVAQDSSLVIVNPSGIAFIVSVVAVRLVGAAAIFHKDLNRTKQITAGIVTASALVSVFFFYREVLMLSAFDGWIYGATIRLH